MTDRHAALKAQYEIDAKHHPRPWELWEYSKSNKWEEFKAYGPSWLPDILYRRKPDALIWPTEKEKAEHLHGWALREIAAGVHHDEFEVHHDNWGDDEWRCIICWFQQVIAGPEKWQVRRKPPKVVMHQIVPGGPQFPAPLTEAPAVGTVVHWPSAMGDAVITEDWRGDSSQLHRLAVGVLHLHKDAAEQQIEAVAHALRGTPV